jgi:hypothetical protein
MYVPFSPAEYEQLKNNLVFDPVLLSRPGNSKETAMSLLFRTIILIEERQDYIAIERLRLTLASGMRIYLDSIHTITRVAGSKAGAYFTRGVVCYYKEVFSHLHIPADLELKPTDLISSLIHELFHAFIHLYNTINGLGKIEAVPILDSLPSEVKQEMIAHCKCHSTNFCGENLLPSCSNYEPYNLFFSYVKKILNFLKSVKSGLAYDNSLMKKIENFFYTPSFCTKLSARQVEMLDLAHGLLGKLPEFRFASEGGFIKKIIRLGKDLAVVKNTLPSKSAKVVYMLEECRQEWLSLEKGWVQVTRSPVEVAPYCMGGDLAGMYIDPIKKVCIYKIELNIPSAHYPLYDLLSNLGMAENYILSNPTKILQVSELEPTLYGILGLRGIGKLMSMDGGDRLGQIWQVQIETVKAKMIPFVCSEGRCETRQSSSALYESSLQFQPTRSSTVGSIASGGASNASVLQYRIDPQQLSLAQTSNFTNTILIGGLALGGLFIAVLLRIAYGKAVSEQQNTNFYNLATPGMRCITEQIRQESEVEVISRREFGVSFAEVEKYYREKMWHLRNPRDCNLLRDFLKDAILGKVDLDIMQEFSRVGYNRKFDLRAVLDKHNFRRMVNPR